MTETTPPADKGILQLGGANISVKELALLLPTVLAALAVTYDVGYFTAMDGRLFTFFSLTEHLVFALQSLPLIVALLLLVVILNFTGLLLQYKKIPTREDVERYKRQGGWMSRPWPMILVGVFVFATLFQLFMLNLRALAMYAILAGIISAAWIMARINVLLPAIVAAFLVSFLAGMDIAKLDRINANVKHLVEMSDGQRNAVRVIRAGERGLVVYDPTSKQYRFMRWDGIKTIETEYGNMPLGQILNRYFRE